MERKLTPSVQSNEQPTAATDAAAAWNEAVLIEQCRQGDGGAFSELVGRYQDRLFNACLRMCGNWAEAEDFAQEALLRAMQSIGGFDARAKFSTWLFRIAMNLMISARRKRRSSKEVPLSLVGEDVDGVPIGKQEDPSKGRPAGASAGAGGAARAEARERDRLVMQALAGLDEDHRAVVILRDVESFDYEQIAEILGVPAGTVKSRLHRARWSLRERLLPLLGEQEKAASDDARRNR